MALPSNISQWEILPLVPPPAGVFSNFLNPKNRAHELHWAAGVCLPIILIFASLRFYAKTFLSRSKTRDDCTTIFPFIIFMRSLISSRRYLYSQLGMLLTPRCATVVLCLFLFLFRFFDDIIAVCGNTTNCFIYCSWVLWVPFLIRAIYWLSRSYAQKRLWNPFLGRS